MAAVTHAAAKPRTGRGAEFAELNLLGSLVVALVVGAGLFFTARESAVALLVAIAVVQGLLAFAWVFGTAMPGRWGGVLIAGMAAAGADVCVSVWPHGKLGTLLPVLALAVPVLFVHQLARGAARVQIVSSLAGIALLVMAEVALPALLQLRHEFRAPDIGGTVVSAVVLAIGGALVVGYLADLVLPTPRFDPDVPRGLPALVCSAAMGAAVGYLLLHEKAAFAHGRAVFVGAALGALAGLVAVAVTFVLHTTSGRPRRIVAALRAGLGPVLPLCLLAPAAFLLCLAIRA
jgi:hypothetical protein